MTQRASDLATTDLATASVVLLCMSLTGGIALALTSVSYWVPWLLVAVTLSLGAAIGVVSKRRTSHDRERPRGADGTEGNGVAPDTVRGRDDEGIFTMPGGSADTSGSATGIPTA